MLPRLLALEHVRDKESTNWVRQIQRKTTEIQFFIDPLSLQEPDQAQSL